MTNVSAATVSIVVIGLAVFVLGLVALGGAFDGTTSSPAGVPSPSPTPNANADGIISTEAEFEDAIVSGASAGGAAVAAFRMKRISNDRSGVPDWLRQCVEEQGHNDPRVCFEKYKRCVTIENPENPQQCEEAVGGGGGASAAERPGFTKTGFNKYPCKALPPNPPTSGTQSLVATGAGGLAHYDFGAKRLVLAPGFAYDMAPETFWATYASVLAGTAPAPTKGTSSIDPPRLGNWAWTYHWDTQIAEYSDNWGNMPMTNRRALFSVDRSLFFTAMGWVFHSRVLLCTSMAGTATE